MMTERCHGLFLYILLMACFQCLATNAQSQAAGTLRGRVLNLNQQPVSRATVSVKDSLKGAPWAFAISNDSGFFQLRLKPGKTGKAWLSAEHLSYSTAQLQISLPDETSELILISLRERDKALDEIVVRAEPPRFQQRGDTTDFRASAYRTDETTKVEDMLRQIPGMQVGQDGRLSFNGKEVEAVMIEGENLTEQNYQVLTRNLNALTVDRIQVVQHFQENRLMKDVSVSDKVGVNLTIDQQFKGRLSGSADLALGTADRRQADLNLIFLRQKIKWIQFLQHNNTGIVPNEGMDYQFDTEGGGKKELSLARDKGLLSAGTLYPPNLGASYINENKDYSGYSIASWKSGKFVHMKVLLAASDSRLTLQSEGEQTAYQPGGLSWQNFFLDRAFQRQKQIGLRYSIRHDAGKKNIGSAWIDLHQVIPQQHYVNQTTGATEDSLMEQLQCKLLSIGFRAEESLKMRNGKLLRIGLRAAYLQPEQDLRISTGRFSAYYALDSMRKRYGQQARPVTQMLAADASLWGKKQRLQYTYGLKLGRLDYQVGAETVLFHPFLETDSLLSRGMTQMTQTYARLFGQLNLQHGKKSHWSFGGFAGLSRGILTSDQLSQKTAPIYLFSAGYTYSINALSQFSIQWQTQQEAAANGYYYPDSVLTGQVAVLNGAEMVTFPSSHVLQANYASNALHKGRVLFVSATWSRSNQQFVTAMDLYPAYSVQSLTPLQGNLNLSILGKLEQHVKPLLSKFSLQASSLLTRFNNLYNGVISEVYLNNLRLQPEWVSTFGGPLNAELSYTVMYSRNRTLPEAGFETSFSQWQHQGYVKLKARVKKKAYMAIQYARYRLSPGNLFNALDIFAKWNPTKKFGLSVSGHNLLNSTTVRQRQISPNSEWTQGFGLVGRYLLVKASLQF